MSQTHTLVLLRHGESVWNKENRFTGWTDVGLSETGVAEAHAAGRRLREAGFGFDCCDTSVLKRCIKSLWLALEELDLMYLPVRLHWRLNERHYGALQGLNKAETAERHSKEQVFLWRRSFDVAPPPLDLDDPRHPKHDPRYRGLDPALLPRAESLKDTIARVLPHWNDTLAPDIRRGRRLFIVAHGNSLRALVKHLDSISDAEIPKLEIPTGVPLVYELDASLKPVKHYYLDGH